ncbi:hypothetical protein [Pseudomonas sp.]|uniref:hypothetical protein n=1 Tax=Pseudomonas sp. TaxID=306 RepID=UPI003D0C1F6F
MNKKAMVLGLAVMVMLVGCGSEEQQAIWTAEKAVKAKLKDPGSARFGKTYFVTDAERSDSTYTTGYVCGEVSAKNSFGAYASPQRFTARAVLGDNLVDVSGLELEGTGIDAEVFERVNWRHCVKAG